jgi:hypothetical protein
MPDAVPTSNMNNIEEVKEPSHSNRKLQKNTIEFTSDIGSIDPVDRAAHDVYESRSFRLQTSADKNET